MREMEEQRGSREKIKNKFKIMKEIEERRESREMRNNNFKKKSLLHSPLHSCHLQSWK
jgi:hypothetical protein